MTECNRQAVLFSSLGRQKVQADFAGGTLTSDAGGLLLREVDRRLGLIGALADCLTTRPRCGEKGGCANQGHTPRQAHTTIPNTPKTEQPKA